MKRRIDQGNNAKRPAAKDGSGRKGSSTPSFRALGIRAVIAIFVVLAVMYGLNAFMPMAVNFIAGGR